MTSTRQKQTGQRKYMARCVGVSPRGVRMRPNRQEKWNWEQSHGRTFTGIVARPALASVSLENVSRRFVQSAQWLASSCACALTVAGWSPAAVRTGGTAGLAAGRAGVVAWLVVGPRVGVLLATAPTGAVWLEAGLCAGIVLAGRLVRCVGGVFEHLRIIGWLRHGAREAMAKVCGDILAVNAA